MRGFVHRPYDHLSDELRKIKGIEQVVLFERDVPEETGPNDFIVTGIDCLALNEVTTLKEKYPNAKIFFCIPLYEDAAEAQMIQAVCKSHGIIVIPPNRSATQIANLIQNHYVTGKKSTSRVVAALGAKYDVGLTSSLILLGKQLTEKSEIRVAILGLNGANPGTSCIRYRGKHLDEIWGSLDGKQLQGEQLIEKMDEIAPNLFFLAGNRDLLKTYTYTAEGIEYLIDLAREQFQIVLLDLGHFVDTPLAVQGLLASDITLVYTNQRQSAKDDWFRMRDQVIERWLEINLNRPTNVWLIGNMMYDSSDVENLSLLSKEYELVPMASLPYINSFYRLEVEKSLLTLSDKKYLAELQRVTDAVIDYYGIPLKADNGQKRKLFGLGRGG